MYAVPIVDGSNGRSEEIIGRWMAMRGCRDEVVIATKAAGRGMSNLITRNRCAPGPHAAAFSGTDGSYASRQRCALASATVSNRVRRRTDPPDDNAPVSQPEKGQLLAACAGSCRRLQTDYLDLFYIHWPDRYVPIFGTHKFKPEEVREAVSFEEQVEGMGELLASGKIKAWGLSNETAYGVTMFCETAKRLGVALPCCIQNDFSLNDRCGPKCDGS